MQTLGRITGPDFDPMHQIWCFDHLLHLTAHTFVSPYESKQTEASGIESTAESQITSTSQPHINGCTQSVVDNNTTTDTSSANAQWNEDQDHINHLESEEVLSSTEPLQAALDKVSNIFTS